MINYGTVKWFNVEKGYGFIASNEGKDIFVHASEVKGIGGDKVLHEGENVSFDIRDEAKGPIAINVEKLH